MDKDPIYSVNDVIASVNRLHGETVRIACVLNVKFEGNSIWHVPENERLPGYGSSLWADFDCEFPPRKLHGRHVIVSAVVDKESGGHRCLWPGSVVVLSIAKNEEALNDNSEANADAIEDLLDEFRAASGEFHKRQMQVSQRSSELHELMQSSYGMDKIMKVWRACHGVQDGQLPPRGINPLSEILRKEFPDIY